MPASSGVAAGLGLLAAATWGGSDFAGGWGARRTSPVLITAAGQISSLAVLLVVCLGLRIPIPANRFLIFGVIGGFEGAFALAIFYRALAMGAMGLTAALTGLLTALVPVLFDLLHSGWPGALTSAGLAAGLLAIWLISRSPSEGAATPRKALLLGASAGVGFGAQLILFKMAAVGGVLWALTSGRVAGSVAILLVLVVARPNGQERRGFWIPGMVSGALDSTGNLFYMMASQLGRLDAAAVISSMYPAGTILLAGIFLRERPTTRQVAGIGLALTAVALLSA